MNNVTVLYEKVQRLNKRSLDVFIDNVLALRYKKNLPDSQKEEAFLLNKINKNLHISQIERFRELKEKRLNTTLSDAENTELLSLLEQVEKLNVQRLKYLTKLARLRSVSVRELMVQLGIFPVING